MKYYNYISGGMTPGHLAAAMTFAFLGWFVYHMIVAGKRDRASHRTPAKWSWSFWLKDNLPNAVKSFILTFALIRFAADILPRVFPNAGDWLNSNDPMWIYFLAGAAKGYIIRLFKNKAKSK